MSRALLLLKEAGQPLDEAHWQQGGFEEVYVVRTWKETRFMLDRKKHR